MMYVVKRNAMLYKARNVIQKLFTQVLKGHPRVCSVTFTSSAMSCEDSCLIKSVAVCMISGNFSHNGCRPRRLVGPSLAGVDKSSSCISTCCSVGSSSALNSIAKHLGSKTNCLTSVSTSSICLHFILVALIGKFRSRNATLFAISPTIPDTETITEFVRPYL